MKIAGMVLAFHVVFLSAAVLIQGCRSTAPGSSQPTPGTASAASDSPNWSSQSDATYTPPPAVAPGYTVPTAPVSTEPLTGLTPAERARSSPTRPDNPDSFFLPPSSQVGSTVAPTPPPAPTSHTVRAGDSLWEIAHMYSVTLPQLRRANPKLKGDSIQPGMVLTLPQGAVAPGGATAALPAPTGSVTSAAATSTYVVRAGDNLATIAARNGTTVAALVEANSLTSTTIRPGQELRIPGTGVATTTTPAPAGPSALATPSSGAVTITVQSGDTLGELARKYDVTVEALMEANNITNARRVPVGKVLVIPGYQAVGSGQIPRNTSNAPTPRPTPAAAPPPAPEPAPVAEPPATIEPLPPGGTMDAPPIVPIDEPTPLP